jgi:hypothetical protein
LGAVGDLRGHALARQEGVNQDVVTGTCVGQHLGQSHAYGARHLGGGAFRPWGFGTGMEDVDDTSLPALLHTGDCQPVEMDRGEHCASKVRLPGVVRVLQEQATYGRAGVVHQHVERSKIRDCRLAYSLVTCCLCYAASSCPMAPRRWSQALGSVTIDLYEMRRITPVQRS